MIEIHYIQHIKVYSDVFGFNLACCVYTTMVVFKWLLAYSPDGLTLFPLGNLLYSKGLLANVANIFSSGILPCCRFGNDVLKIRWRQIVGIKTYLFISVVRC